MHPSPGTFTSSAGITSDGAACCVFANVSFPAMALPALTDADVRAWTAERFYERGRRYFDEGRLQHPRRAGSTLKVECVGSQPQPYRVEVRLDAEGITSARCSCPMGEGGRCKHVVALLLAWVHDASTFTETAALADALHKHDKGQLVALIEQMIDRHPDLERLARLSTDAGAPLDEVRLRQEVEQVLPDFDAGYAPHGYDTPHAVGEALEDFLIVGDDYAQRGHLGDAARAYETVARAILDNYEAAFDHEGDISYAVHQCTERLAALLETTDDANLRLRILRVLFDVWCWDTDRGGYGISDAVPGIVIDRATPAERHRVAGWVREKLPGSNELNEPASSPAPWVGCTPSRTRFEWRHERYGQFLLDLEADTLSDEEYLDICRRCGLLEERVERLLVLGRTEEALDAASSDASAHQLARLAERFVEHGAGEAVCDRIEERVAGQVGAGNDAGRLTEWLRDYAREHGDEEAALRLSKKMFWHRPSVEKYEPVRAAAQALGTWNEERGEILRRLEDDDRFALLTRLHLADGHVEDALGTVHRAEASLRGGPSLKIAVARAAEDEAPQQATDLYLEVACDLIDQRGRDNYAQAAEHLDRIKRIHQQQSSEADWHNLIAMIREDNSNLPALQDELDKAGL